jgi:hypothetical protein
MSLTDDANKLKTDAKSFLEESNIIGELEKFGQVSVVGSYMFNLMTWKDIDIEISNEEMNPEQFFDLGEYFFEQLGPKSMKFEDRVKYPSKHVPNGYYWGIVSDSDWKLDVWYMNDYDAKLNEKKRNELFRNLNEENRELILAIKNSDDYMKHFTSMDVYKAVLKDQIKSVSDFYMMLTR